MDLKKGKKKQTELTALFPRMFEGEKTPPPPSPRTYKQESLIDFCPLVLIIVISERLKFQNHEGKRKFS